MIRVFVYVTGLTLAQYAPTTTAPAVVYLPSGLHDYAPGVPEMTHTLKVERMDRGMPSVVAIETPWVALFEVTPAARIVPPAAIADLGDLLEKPQTVRDECRIECTGAGCRLPRTGACSSRSGDRIQAAVAFSGPWQTAPVADCAEGFAPAARQADLPLMNFLAAGKAWTTRYPAPVSTANSTLFWVDVADLSQLKVTQNQPIVKVEELTGPDGRQTCASLGAPGAEPRCAVIAIRNEMAMERVNDGSADPHFAPLYGLLKEPPPAADMFLPVLVEGTMCPGGGGCCGQLRCIGGYIEARP